MQTMLWNFDKPITHMDILLALKLEGQWYSRKQIADELRRAKSPSLILKLDDLVYSGYLHSEDRPLPNGINMVVYALSERGMDAILHGALPAAL